MRSSFRDSRGRKGGCWLHKLVSVAAVLWVMIGLLQAAPAPVAGDWKTAANAMALEEGADAVMVQAVVLADTQRLVFRFPSIDLSRRADGTVDVSLPSTDQWRQPGAPILPMLSTRVALPQGHELVSVTVIPADPVETVLDAPVRHAQRPFPLSRPQDRVDTPASRAIYESDEPYPSSFNTAGSVQTKRGVGFVELVLFPVSYRPASGRLTAYGTLTLEVVSRPATQSGLSVSAVDAGWRARVRSAEDVASLSALMDNPKTLDAYQPESTVAIDSGLVTLAAAEDPGQPTLPCRLSDIFNHVIITTRNIRDGIVDAGAAIAEIYEEHAYLFIVPAPGTPWVLDTEAIANAGGYPIEIDDEAEQEFVDENMDELNITTNDYYFIYEFDDPTYDGDTNGIPDWQEILTGTDVNGLPFQFTFIAFTNQPLDALVAIREAQGLSSTVVSIESILEVYQTVGLDEAQALRAFIRDAYDKWITEYVVVVGDGQVMPMRYLYAEAPPYVDGLPSDLYFQCLDGSFNSDGDFYWGEPTDGADRLDGRPGEDIDLYAELAIGRVAISDAIGMSNWVAKVVQYETDRLAGTEPYLSGALMVGEYLGFGGISDYAKPMMEEIRLGSSEHGYTTEGFEALDIHTNIVTLYDYDRSWTKYTLAAYINSNQFSVLNHLGHCDSDYCMRFDIPDVKRLLTNSAPAFLYTQGCWPGAFDMDCIAGEFLGQTNALFGGVFNSRYGWGENESTDGPSQRYNRWFWHTFFGELVPVTGILNQMAHERNAPRINEEYMRWCYYESNLHGDPAQWLYGIEPDVIFDREAYRSDAAAVVDVILPLAGPNLQQVTVTVTTLTAGGGSIATTNVICPRVGPTDMTARFASAPISLADLGAVNYGTVRVDATLALGGTPVARYDTADITDDPPIITSYSLTADETYIDFSFTTDRPVTSEARIGESVPLTADWETVSDERVLYHSIRFDGLEPFTEYFIGVRIEDAAGIVVVFPSNLFSEVEGDYDYSIATIGRETILRTDWEQHADGWTRTNINGGVCWEYGQPLTYGPQEDVRCWGTRLNGRYPDGANALLISPPFGVREKPMLIVRHWVDMQYSMGMDDVLPSPPPFGDHGQIEVLSSGIWYNVTAYIEPGAVDTLVASDPNTLITGQSDGWETLRVNLPERFANQALSVRFKFTSDQQSFGTGNPAGWYLDSLTVQDVPGDGLGISLVSIRDDNGLFNGLLLDGDEDGFAEAGETVALRPYLFNYGTDTFGDLSGTLTVQVGGYPATYARLPDATPAPISYTGTIAPADLVPANEWIRLQLSSDLAPGTVVSLIQSVTNAAGARLDARYDLVIQPVVPISGQVVDAVTSNAVNAASVTAALGDGYLTTVTGADGRFVFQGLMLDETYTVTAAKPGVYADQTQYVRAPASNVLFTLGFPVVSYAPTSLDYLVVAGGTAMDSIVFSNAVDATAPLHMVLDEIDYHPAASGWLSVSPTNAVLAPGRDVSVGVTVNADGLSAGVYMADLVFETDDPAAIEIRVPVELTVWREPELSFDGMLFEDDYAGDGDGRLEAGETARLWVYLRNSSGRSDVVDITGTLTSANTNVTINPPPTMHWQFIAPYRSRLSTNGVEVVLDPATPAGERVEFNLELVWFDGIVWQTNQIPFSYNYQPYHSVSGVVEGVIWNEKEGIPNGTEPVAGARVSAEDIEGNMFWSMPTDTNGFYVLPPLPEGDLWFKVYEPDGSSYVPPAGSNIMVNADMVQDFLLNNYGSNAPIVRLDDFYAYDWGLGSDYDYAIEPGETIWISVDVYNEGGENATNVTDFLTVADMGSYGPFMSVTNPSTGMTNIIETIPEWAINYPYFYSEELEYFEVTVNTNATEGAKQRFWLDITDGSRVWPFDIAITVASRLSISGYVRHEFSGIGEDDVVVQLELPDGTILPDETWYNGYYEFEGLEPGLTNIIVRAIPPGDLSVEPLTYTINVLSNDVENLDFVLKASQLTLSPSPFSATINEGQTTSRWLTVNNTSTNDTTVDLGVVYARGDADILTPPEHDPLSLILAATTDWNELDSDDYVPGQLEIRFADGTGVMEREAILKRYGLRAIMHMKLIPACLASPINMPELGAQPLTALAPLAQTLSGDPAIQYVQPAARMTPSVLPNDPLFTNLYGLVNNRQTGGTRGADINVSNLWDRTTGSRDIIVAVCDTGFDKTHPDLLPNLWRNPGELSGDANYDDYPGTKDIDDDGDRTNQLYHYDAVSGTTLGPEVVDPLFDPEMWEDNLTRAIVPGVAPRTNQWVKGANGKPDFFEMYLNEELPLTDLVLNEPTHFGDDDGDGIPNVFEDNTGPNGVPDGIPDIFGDEDGDGIINETGIDFRDEDVMQGRYTTNGVPLITQIYWTLPWLNSKRFRVVLEQWDIAQGEYELDGADYAAYDDDENGYADDYNGWNFFHWDSDVTDGDVQSAHGTHVAGTIGAVGSNGVGVAGVNWNVSIMPLALVYRASDPFTGSPFTESMYIAKAIEYAITHGARVSNHSWGGGAASGVLYEIMALAERDYNHLFVIAAGNSANDVDNRKVYPAYFSTSLDNVITVAATDDHDQLAEFSNYGLNSVQLAAPGVDIYSTWSSRSVSIIRMFLPKVLEEMLTSGELIYDDGAYYRRMSGTSMATPHVTGAAALLWSLSPQSDYRIIKQALLDGVRLESNLDGWVKTGGLLDIGRSVQVMGTEWLHFTTNHVSVAAGDSAQVEVIFNPNQDTPPGVFNAEIVAEGAVGRDRLAAQLTVLSGGALTLSGLRITDDATGGDGDGYAEPGETVSFVIELHNPGNIPFSSVSGTLTGVSAGAVVDSDTASWGVLYGGENAESTPFTVTLPNPAPAETQFALLLTGSGLTPRTLEVWLPTQQRNSIAGRVVTLGGNGVAGARVEYHGVSGGFVSSAADGYFRLDGLLDGDYRLRAIPSGASRSTDLPITLNGNDASNAVLTVSEPVVTLSQDDLQASLVNEMQTTQTVSVNNAGSDAFAYTLDVMPQRRIGLFSDGASLEVLVTPLQRMGFDVDHYTNNYETVHEIDPATALESIVQDVRYTDDDATVFSYDLVIVDLTGPHAGGRVFSELEADVFSRYLDLGGMVIFTGGNPLNRPDNAAIAAMCGVDLGYVATSRVDQAVAVSDWDGAFVSLSAGDQLAVSNFVHDSAMPTNTATQVLFMAGAASKITRISDVGAKSRGEAIFWGGNPQACDWAHEGAWLDVLRDMLAQRFIQPMATQTRVPWLTASPVADSVTAGTVNFDVTVSAGYLAADTYRAVILLRGLDTDEEIIPLPVSLTVSSYLLRAYTSGGVVDVDGKPLPGSGNDESPIYQVIYAGADGLVDRPNTTTGIPGGDDRLMAVIPSGQPFGRIGGGQGVDPDSGRFNQRFINTIPTDAVDPKVYIRAWDGASFASSLAYGDSGLSNLIFSADFEIDFGTWMVNQSISLTLDSNNDTLPDAWLREYRPDIDPTAVREPLATAVDAHVIATLTTQLPSETPPRPFRVRFSADKAFMFVLDQANNRLITIPTNAPAARIFYGGSGTTNGRFAQPEGLAVDPRAGQHRLAVADTGNNRIQLFTYNPTNGVVTFERAIGTEGSGVGQLNRPGGVAFDDLGRLFVADTSNHRVAKFRLFDGVWMEPFTGSLSYELYLPRGLTYDPNYSATDGGVWVCDTGNDRLSLFWDSGTARRGFGMAGTANGRFNDPVDVQIWRVGTRQRLVVADKTNNRIQLFNMDGTPLASLGTGGGLVGQLSLPHGVQPLNDSANLYIADTANARIQRFTVMVDADEDGMDDFWEDINGLNSQVDDADWDLDNDGLKNIAEYLIGTDPDNSDTNGDGTSDGEAVANMLDPLAVRDLRIESLQLDALGGGNVLLEWRSVDGVVYQVETNGSLLGGVWGVYTNIIGTGTSSSAELPPPGQSFLFFRIKRLP